MQNQSKTLSISTILYCLAILSCSCLVGLSLKGNKAIAQVASSTIPQSDRRPREQRNQRLEQQQQLLEDKQRQFQQESRQQWSDRQQQWENQNRLRQIEYRDYRRQQQQDVYQRNEQRRQEQIHRQQDQRIILPR